MSEKLRSREGSRSREQHHALFRVPSLEKGSRGVAVAAFRRLLAPTGILWGSDKTWELPVSVWVDGVSRI